MTRPPDTPPATDTPPSRLAPDDLDDGPESALPDGERSPGGRLPRTVSRARAPLLALLVAIGAGQALGAIATAVLVQQAFDRLVVADPAVTVTTRTVVGLTAGLLGAVALTAVMRRAERVAAERLGQHYVAEVRDRLFRHLTRVPARELGRRHRGSMLMRFVGDLSALRGWVSLGLARLVVAGIAVTLAVAALTVSDVGLGLAVGGVLLLGAGCTGLASPRLLSTSREARRRRARLTGEVTERLTHVGVLQASGQERRERRRVRKHSDRVVTAMIDRARAAGNARAVAEGTAGLATVAVVLVGALEVRAGRTSPGAVVGAMAVTGLLAGHLRDLGRVAEYAAAAHVGREAVRRFLALPTLDRGRDLPELEAGPGRVELRDLALGDALRGVTLTAEPGQTVAIVGPNGAGKSTLVALAARLVDPDGGAVLLDGQDLRERELSSVRASVGAAGPDLPLLKGSLGRNVRYRLPRVVDHEVDRVVDLCDLRPLLDELGGWQADVGDGGALLSAGQRARVAVARAALGRPRLLVLDEAEAHLDGDAARVVDRVLDDHRGTALVVTHRRELVERADTVWCLVDGRVAEAGAPRVLLAGDGPTARLFARPALPVADAAAVTQDPAATQDPALVAR